MVARHGELIWDTHPSRAGLLGELRYSVLAPFPASWRETWDRNARDCECTECGNKPANVPDGAAFIR